MDEYKPCLPHALCGGAIGACIGVLPGLGSAIAAFISYGEGKHRAKNTEQWGKGALGGMVYGSGSLSNNIGCLDVG